MTYLILSASFVRQSRCQCCYVEVVQLCSSIYEISHNAAIRCTVLHQIGVQHKICPICVGLVACADTRHGE